MATSLSITAQQDDNLETYSLIWLDASVNDSHENVEAQKQLQISINYLVTFEDDQKCLQHIESTCTDDRIIFIVSGKLGQTIVPKIVQYRQLVSIYVYCMNKTANEQWAKQFDKVKAVVVQLNDLIHRIKTDQHQREHSQIDETLPFCIINSNDDNQEQSTTDLSGQFLHFQLLIDCLIKMKSTDTDRNELIALCKQQYLRNSAEFKIVEEFEREYSSKRVVWWYTRDSFLHRILNKALRKGIIHLLFLFRFIIHDLAEHLKTNQCSSALRVYRAQLMSNDEIQIFKNSLGECVAINSFFSTSTDRQQAKSFISLGGNSHDVQPVIFEIDANPQ